MLDIVWPRFKTRQSAKSLYTKAVNQARHPFFYSHLCVPDSIDGRFEMISLHVILILSVLPESKEGQKTGQALFDVMFKDMDKSLREMAIGDLSVPKHMKRMMNGFNGRMQCYKRAFTNGDELNKVLQRNVYGTVEKPEQGHIEGLHDYVMNSYCDLKLQESKKILDGIVHYPEL